MIGAAGLLGGAFAASTVNWASPSSGALPNAEVYTNSVFQVNTEKMQEASFKLEVAGSIAGEVILAIGSDSDEDGDLSFDEVAFFIGNNAGEKYTVNAATSEFTCGVDTVKVKARNFDPGWNTAKIIKRGTSIISETASMTVENKMFVIRIR